ncbi:Signal transduction histidine-protein kinase/phosphatase DegS [Kordia antarctica]|uniref:histidine kinase n=1 Tax=Kordia antarctica TaxID=1218801 RepID=A0A7L4ZNT8_9FLAO|nr:sensor histidine kinase [Kordia antarctica]QHI38137.1 Signal transduction histidine-protein kinase/phosphatase DegS [Kordia antarctica]
MRSLLVFVLLFPFVLLGQTPKIDSLKQSLHAATDRYESAKIKLQLAKLYERVDLSKAKSYAFEAFLFSTNDSLHAETNNEIGRLHFFTGNLDSATIYFENSKGLLSKLNDSNRVAIINISLGAISLRQGNYEKTIKILTESASFFEKNKDELNAAKCYSNIASAFAELENYDKAIEYSEKALQIFNDNDFVQFQLITLPNLATQYFKKGDTIKAIGYYTKAETLAKNLNDKRSLSLIYNNLGNIYLESESQRAKEYLEKAYQLKNELNLKSGIEITESNLGFIYLKNKEYQKAISYLERAKPVIKGKQLTLVYTYLKSAYEGLNDTKKALYFSEKARILNDSLLSVENQKTILEIQTKYETAKSEKEIIQLQSDNSEANHKRKQNRNLLFAALGILLISLFIIYILLKNAKKKRIITAQSLTIKEQEFNQLLKTKELEGIDAILDAQEKERMDMAADLHDNLGSKVATLKLYMESYDDKEDFTAYYDKIKKLLDTTYVEIRNISKNKNFGARIDKGLIPSTKAIAKQISETKKLHIDVINIDVKKRLENTLEIQLFRIIQELLTNIIKHANATEATIQFSEENNMLNIVVEDNGKGFNITKKVSGIGLINIEKRIEKLKGDLFIDASEGNGTTIILNIPL